MPIVSSALIEEGVQVDGRRWVRETHTDQLGASYVVSWLAGAGDLGGSQIAAHAAQLEDQLAAAETLQNMAAVVSDGSLAVLTFAYSTVAQNRGALRIAYMAATRQEAVMIGDFLSTLTNAQLQALFGLTAGQVTTLRTAKLTPASNAASTIRATTGA